MKRLVY